MQLFKSVSYNIMFILDIVFIVNGENNTTKLSLTH